LWTSPNNKSFVAVTAHYINDNWVLQELIIDFGLMTGKHDGLLAVTLDNASNNNAFVQELEMKLSEELSIEWDSERLRFRCFNHILNLAVQAALDCIKDDIEISSTHNMVKNALSLKSALNTVTSSHDNFQQYAISHHQWATLEQIIKLLEPFKDLTIKMSSSTDSTAYLIIPLFNIILNHVKDTASNIISKGKLIIWI
ncbi:9092_t:CDS:2, partial [Gigaspora rosea]